MTSINIKIFSPDHEYDPVEIDTADIRDRILSLAGDVARGLPEPVETIFMRILHTALIEGVVEHGDRQLTALRCACAVLGNLSRQTPLDVIAGFRHIVVDARAEGLMIFPIKAALDDCDIAYETASAQARARFPYAPDHVPTTAQ
jgi:hypothetical protein